MTDVSSPTPRIFIILPVHNRLPITKKFICCLLEQSFQNYRLVVVDDGSTDGTADFVTANVPNSIVLKGDGNLWWGGALHKAYRYISKMVIAPNDIILTINDDCIYDENYLRDIADDSGLSESSIVISPGQSIHSDFVERGFSIDWYTFAIEKLKEGEQPDALTTRGLYMYFSVYQKIGGFHPYLLPHYLSDLEYTIRAKQKGFQLVISNSSRIYVDRSSTGQHVDRSKTYMEFFKNTLLSKRYANNSLYWGNFCLLAAPTELKLPSAVRAWKYFFIFPLLLRLINSLAHWLKRNRCEKYAISIYSFLIKKEGKESKLCFIGKNIHLFYYFRANVYLDLKSYNQAIDDYNHALEIKPELAIAYKNRSIALKHLGRSREAEEDYSKACSLNPGLKNKVT